MKKKRYTSVGLFRSFPPSHLYSQLNCAKMRTILPVLGGHISVEYGKIGVQDRKSTFFHLISLTSPSKLRTPPLPISSGVFFIYPTEVEKNLNLIFKSASYYLMFTSISKVYFALGSILFGAKIKKEKKEKKPSLTEYRHQMHSVFCKIFDSILLCS